MVTQGGTSWFGGQLGWLLLRSTCVVIIPCHHRDLAFSSQILPVFVLKVRIP